MEKYESTILIILVVIAVIVSAISLLLMLNPDCYTFIRQSIQDEVKRCI